MLKNIIIIALFIFSFVTCKDNNKLVDKLTIANKAMEVTKLPEYEVAVDLPEEYMNINHDKFHADKLVGYIDNDTLHIFFDNKQQ